LKGSIELLKVKDIMTKEVVTASKDASILEAAKTMDKHKLGNVVVVEGDRPIGILTVKDIIRRAIVKELDLSHTVEEIMTYPIITIDKEADITKAGKLMSEKGVQKLPVVENERLVGIFTMADLLKVSPTYIAEFAKTFGKIEEILKNL
jgi:CBS domain-containing protein